MTVQVSGAGLRGFLLGAFSMWLVWLLIPVTAARFLGWVVALTLVGSPVWGAMLCMRLWRAHHAGTTLVERGAGSPLFAGDAENAVFLASYDAATENPGSTISRAQQHPDASQAV